MLNEVTPLTYDDVYKWVKSQPRIKGRAVADACSSYRCLIALAANAVLGGVWYVSPSTFSIGYMSTENDPKASDTPGYQSKVYALSPELNKLANDFDERYSFLKPYQPSRDSLLAWMRQRRKAEVHAG